MDDERAMASSSTPIGPAQARAMRHSGSFEVNPGAPDDQPDEGDSGGAGVEDEPTAVDSARDAATAADQAARLSQINQRADGLLERLRAGEVDVATPATEPAAESTEPEPKRRRWRR